MIEYADLFARCEKQFNFQIHAAEPIKLGWLNKKWILHTNKGKYVLKKYHNNRFKSVDTLRIALTQQHRLSQMMFPSPVLLEWEGEILHADESGERYILMQYCEGSGIAPGMADRSHMYSLGRIIGQLHHHLNDGTLSGKSEPDFMPHAVEARLAHWDDVIEQAVQMNKPHLVPIMELQKKMTQSLNLPALQQACRQGWAHRDLWMDNLLFREETVSAVLDFDRLNFDYLDFDIARAILSGAFLEGQLDFGKTKAFLQGYQETAGFEVNYLSDIIRLLWYLESKWWITAEMDNHHRIPARFAEEMIWIAEHHEQLDEMLMGM
ncbi:phosphotransferase [Paenibacillus lupini]|uniref:phosphotransferase n=1 Tax=Paenibacillus lupini TaxID=1450204 RepID=UPI001423251A|nr:phosphotransferase [Paenibacillus lupini]NIK23269.1 homoserine kinase type II [Paenibacillus lupini]